MGGTHSGNDRVVEASGKVERTPSPILTLSREEGGHEEAFPALPQSTGHRETSEMPSPPLPPVTTTGLGRLDYSTLAERLAAEAALAATAAAAADTSSSEPQARAVGESPLRLSILPGFGDGRRDKNRDQGTSTDNPSGVDASPTLELSSPKLEGAEAECVDGSLPKSLPPTPPPNPADQNAGITRRAGTVSETVALRARLRERWFRLEAARKAQRQRELAERGMMAMDDVNVIVGDGINLEPSGDVDGSESSEGDRDSSGDSGTISNRGEARDQTLLQVLHGSPRTTTTQAFSVVAFSPAEPRAASAPNISAMRLSEAAAASTAATPTTEPTPLSGLSEARVAHEELPRPSTPEKMNASVVATSLDGTPGLYDADDAGMVCPEERVHAACEAGKAGVLNDLLVRSAGRVADGRDKVRA